HPLSLAAVSGLVAGEAGALAPAPLGGAAGPVRIVAGRAGHPVVPLEALALPQVLHLVGHVVFLGVFALDDPEVGRERFPRPVAESRAAAFGGVAVALGTEIQLTLARQAAGVDDVLGRIRLGMRPVKGHVLAARTVAALTGDADEDGVAPVRIGPAGNGLKS